MDLSGFFRSSGGAPVWEQYRSFFHEVFVSTSEVQVLKPTVCILTCACSTNSSKSVGKDTIAETMAEEAGNHAVVFCGAPRIKHAPTGTRKDCLGLVKTAAYRMSCHTVLYSSYLATNTQVNSTRNVEYANRARRKNKKTHLTSDVRIRDPLCVTIWQAAGLPGFQREAAARKPHSPHLQKSEGFRNSPALCSGVESN